MRRDTLDRFETRKMIIEANGVFYMYINAIPVGSAPTRAKAEWQLNSFVYWLWQGIEQHLIRLAAERAMGRMRYLT